ncbi:SIR2 family protein [Enterococcus casseliflavus]|uniref:SIR2 family protein n=1 Tax=Enterococcus casseliflavus TaxID=37734 RepID=UPI0023D8574F|nr:SIR2 family protein [Enterococcus casseliflavus]WEI91850.1 SIR2 family protein [Enterococcus casseliflavus]
MFFFDFDFKNNNVPSFDKMMIPTILALQELGGKAKIKALDSKVVEIMNLPREIAEIPHNNDSNRSEVSYRLAWARTYLKKYGLIENTTRGTWSFTDSFNGNIGDINPESIIKAVREEKATDRYILSNIESARAFENLVYGVIKERTRSQKKRYSFSDSDNLNSGFDIKLPDGIDNIEGLTYGIIKYANPKNQDIEYLIANALQKSDELGTNYTVLLIINFQLSDTQKKNILENVKHSLRNNLVIWDNIDLLEKTNPESHYTKYILSPKRALIEDTLTINQSQKDKDKNKSNHIEHVRQAYKNNDLVLFLGAGVSIDSGIPLWSDLVKKLLIQMIIKRSGNKELTSEEIDMLSELAYNNKEDSPLTQMRYIRSAFEDHEYYRLVHDVLYSKPLSKNNKVLDAIIKIAAPQYSNAGLKSIITYNFDDLIEQKFKEKEFEYNSIYQEENMVAIDKLNIYHVHGYLPSNWSKEESAINLIFSEEDYHRVYRDSFSWSNLTQINALRDNTCLFIGCSLTDPNLRRLLDVSTRNKESARHYAILRKNIVGTADAEHKSLLKIYQSIDDNIREAYFQELGINIIWVNSFEEIPDIILKLKN